MKTLVAKMPLYLPTSFDTDFRWPEDVARIVKICADNGYSISDKEAQAAWEEFSDSVCAGWIILGDDDNVVLGVVLDFCKIKGE